MIIVTEQVESELVYIVLRLGSFHTEMSYLGCIGHLMATSGLQELRQLTYAPNAVMHMLTGKAISRAIRAQLIVGAVLSALVLAKTFNVPLPGSSDDRNVETEEFLEATTSSHEKSARHPDLDEAAVLYEKVMQGSMSADQVCQSGVITRIGDALQRETKSLKSYRTATLWL